MKLDMEQSLYGGGLSAKLEVTAKNFINFHNADFQLDATIKNDLRPRIVQLIKNELKSVDPINFVGTVVNEALKTFEVKKMGFKTKLKGFNKASVNVHVDARLAGQKIPINVTVNLNAGSIDKIANAVAKEIAKELQKAGSVLLKGLEDIGAGIYLAGKETIQWTSGAAETSANWLSGAMGAAGEWIVGAGGTIISAFSSSRRYDCPNVPFTAPANGRIAGSLPPGINQYRIKLHHIKTVDKGHEDNSTLEIWGSITVKTNMAMQQDANPWLYNNSCRSTTKCKYNEANTEVSHFIDFFIESNKIPTATGVIELDLYEGDPGVDDPFKKQTFDFVYENRVGLRYSQILEHEITLEEDHNNPQKIEVLISVERIYEPLHSPFVHIQKSGGISADQYLSFNSSENVSLSALNQGNNLQTWGVVNRYDGSYNIKINGGTNPDKTYLGSTTNGDLKFYDKDDGSGLQRWEFHKRTDGTYRIKIKGGTNTDKKYLSVTTDGTMGLMKKPTTPLGSAVVGNQRMIWELESTRGVTCDDGIRNQGETKTDCGGPNCDPCGTCNDGIQNQGETEVDCGGPNCDPCPSCYDGIENQGETGVDCGGPCDTCPTCIDGIENQGETGVDCGGPCGIPCGLTTSFGVGSRFEYGYVFELDETGQSGKIFIANNSNYHRLDVGPNLNILRGLYHQNYKLPTQDELCQIRNQFLRGKFRDEFSNYIKNTYWIAGKKVIKWDSPSYPCMESNEPEASMILVRDFSLNKCADGILNNGETSIDCGGPNCYPCATCNDGIQNQGETGVDCGGSCNPCPTCNDGIMNQGETDVDCGGPNCDPCPTCNDGVKNQGETGVDCGGPNCDPCGTCNDGIQNQEETGIDCGGPNCASCATCNDGIQNQGETEVDCGGPNCEPCKLQFGNAEYKIISKATGKVFDLNMGTGNLASYDYHGGDNQLWNIEYIEGTDNVKIVSKATNKVLDLNRANGNISQYNFHGGDNQLWAIKPIEGTDYMKIVSKATGKVLDLNQANGNISEYNFHEGDNQLWIIESVSNATLGGENKLYTIQQKSNNRFMDAYEKSSKDFSLTTRPSQNNNTQRWIILPLGNDTYTIQQKSNGRFMDAHQKSARDYSIVTRPPQNDDTQRWIILPLGNDTYTIQQKSNGRFMDAHLKSTRDFSIVTRPPQNDDTQRWIIKLQ